MKNKHAVALVANYWKDKSPEERSAIMSARLKKYWKKQGKKKRSDFMRKIALLRKENRAKGKNT